eukprot:s1736_g1.t1
MGSIDVAGDGEEDSHWLRGLRSRRLSQPDSPGSAETEEEGSSPDLEALRARQQRLRELKAGLAAAHLEDEEEEEELEEEDDPEEEEEDEVTSDSPQSLSGPSQASVGQVNSGSAPVGVLVRCRPLLKEGSRIKLSASSAKSGKVMLRLQPEEQSRSRQSEPKVFRCNGFISEEGTQADVFEHVAPVVDRVMEGYNGVVFCYGITGSGKTHTMSGPPKEPLAKQVKDPAPPEVIAAQQGIVQRAAKRIFEFIRDRSARGEMFTVEASFLEIYSPDGVRENLIDLLANKADEAKLEVKQDALVGHKAFMCEGLKSVPIRSPDEMRQVLEGGRRRCTYMETSRNCVSSRPLNRREHVSVSTQMIGEQITILNVVDVLSGMALAVVIPTKARTLYSQAELRRVVLETGRTFGVLQADPEPALLAIATAVTGEVGGLSLRKTPVGWKQAQGTVGNMQATLYGQIKALRLEILVMRSGL